MQERGTWFVPTYVTMDAMNEERYDYVLRLRGKHMVPQLERAIRAAHRIGVRIATGADHYYEEDAINRISIEVERFVQFGMSNFEAKMDDRTGRIQEGFEADLILIPGNPLTNIEALQDVLLVMSDGKLALKRIPFAVTD
jgi:imidazolonepropionase-like amidohydrolase